MQVAATFGIPLVRTEIVTKRKRDDDEEEDDEDEEYQVTEPTRVRMDAIGSSGGSGGLPGRSSGEALPKKKNPPSAASNPPGKKRGAQNSRSAGRFQNQKLVKLINANVGMEVSTCS